MFDSFFFNQFLNKYVYLLISSFCYLRNSRSLFFTIKITSSFTDLNFVWSECFRRDRNVPPPDRKILTRLRIIIYQSIFTWRPSVFERELKTKQAEGFIDDLKMAKLAITFCTFILLTTIFQEEDYTNGSNVLKIGLKNFLYINHVLDRVINHYFWAVRSVTDLILSLVGFLTILYIHYHEKLTTESGKFHRHSLQRFSDTNEETDDEEKDICKKRLTWDEFLKLSTIVTNLDDSIYFFKSKNKEIKKKNQRIAAAAKEYLDFFNDSKYIYFMNEVRISFTKMLLSCIK